MAFTFFQCFFSDCALCILLDTAGTWGLYFCLRDSQNEFFFKTGTFALFYGASWWIGVPVPQTGRSVKPGASQHRSGDEETSEGFSDILAAPCIPFP